MTSRTSGKATLTGQPGADHRLVIGEPERAAHGLPDRRRPDAHVAGIAIGARQLDPLKTTIVQDQRCMTTWVLARD